MDRVLLNQQGTISTVWEQDGGPLAPSSPVTVTVVNDAGTTLVNAQTATVSGNTTTYILPLTATASLDRLTVTWTASNGASIVTYCEVTGAFLFSMAQARARSPLQDNTTYPDSAVQWYRTLAEEAIEDICGVAFVPRFRRDVGSIVNWGMLEVPRRRLRTVRQIYTQTDSGAVAVTTLSGLRIENGSVIFMPNMWTWWSAPIQVAYESGYDTPPHRVSRAALELARRWLVESPWDERMIAFRSREGGEIDILTAKGDPFDLPEVVAVAEIYGTPLVG